MSSVTDHFDTVFFFTLWTIQENVRDNWSTISLPFTTFTMYLSMALLNSRSATSFSPINGFYASLNMISTCSWCETERTRTLPCCLLPRLPPLNDCVVTKQTFCVVLERFCTRYFCSNSIVFISTVGYSYEDNCCQSQGIGNLIKENLLKGIFRVD